LGAPFSKRQARLCGRRVFIFFLTSYLFLFMRLSNAEFYEPIARALQSVQSALDAYQKSCFPERPSEFFALELCGEAGELANLEKKRWKGKSVAKEAIADEAADTLIALMNFSNAAGVQLGEAVRAKLAVIEQRRQAEAAQSEE
jgi:NTP pyrophosphatase (non-canonical NTP hydrolase)